MKDQEIIEATIDIRDSAGVVVGGLRVLPTNKARYEDMARRSWEFVQDWWVSHFSFYWGA